MEGKDEGYAGGLGRKGRDQRIGMKFVGISEEEKSVRKIETRGKENKVKGNEMEERNTKEIIGRKRE